MIPILFGRAIAASLVLAASFFLLPVALFAATLTVTAPDGGDSFEAENQRVEIEWKIAAGAGPYHFHYFLVPDEETDVLPPPPPGGSALAFIESFRGYSVGGRAGAKNQSAYKDTIILDSDLPSGEYELLIYASTKTLFSDPEDASFHGETDGTFAITNVHGGDREITIESPEALDVWEMGWPQTVLWESKGVSAVSIALQDLSTGQPCALATNIPASRGAWLFVPATGTRCLGSSSRSLQTGEHKIALYDADWQRTRVSAYGDAPFRITKADPPTTDKEVRERLIALIGALTELLERLAR